MKKEDLLKFEVFDLYAKICSIENFAMNDRANIECVVNDIKKVINTNKENKILLYGKKTELLFYYIVKSLNNINFIKQEDSGLYFFDEDLGVPDYHIVTKNDEKFFVEVKNTNKSINKKYCMDSKYLDKMKRYCEYLNEKLYIAIYWRKLNLWTLKNFL